MPRYEVIGEPIHEPFVKEWIHPRYHTNITSCFKSKVTVGIFEDDGSKRLEEYGHISSAEIKAIVDRNEKIDINWCCCEEILVNNRKIISVSACFAIIAKINAERTEFSGCVDFSGAKFIGAICFRSAKFADHAYFQKALFCGKFLGTQLNENADFACTQFRGEGIFSDTQFIGNAEFFGAKFNIMSSFSNAKFFEEACFISTEFIGIVDFGEAEFIGFANFSEACFSGDIAYYINAKFNDKVYFEDVLFSSEACFEGANFSSEAYFGNTQFTGNATFDNCQNDNADIIFHNVLFLSYINLQKMKIRKLSFEESVIEKWIDLRFSNVDALSLCGVKNLGQIYIEWDRDRVSKAIHGISYQTEMSNMGLARQFRLLKENFHMLGQYDDEDKAYVEFKQHEALAMRDGEEKANRSRLQKIHDYSQWAFRWFIQDYIGGYGTQPLRILRALVGSIVIFTVIYILLGQDPGKDVLQKFQTQLPFTNHIARVVGVFYFSAITTFTVGYGDISASNIWTAIVSCIQAFIGVFLMSYFTVAFARKVLR